MGIVTWPSADLTETWRRAAARMATLAVTFALVVTGLAAPTAQAATADLRTPLGSAEDPQFRVVAASGSSIVAYGAAVGYRLSQDSGATWAPADLGPGADQYLSHVADGKAVREPSDSSGELSVFSLTANTLQTHSLTSDPEGYNATTAIDETGPGAFDAVNLATGSRTALVVEGVPAPTRSWVWSGFEVGATVAVRVTTSNDEVSWDRGDGYLDVVPLAGGAGPAPVLVPGLDRVVIAGDQVVYTMVSETDLRVCRRPLTMVGDPTCVIALTGDYSQAGSYAFTATRSWALVLDDSGTRPVLIESGAVKPVTVPTGTTEVCVTGGDPTRPVVTLWSSTESSIQRINPDGSLTRLFALWHAPALPVSLALAPTHAYGADQAPSATADGQGWSRSLTRFDTGSLLPAPTSQVHASAGRLTATTASGVQVFDRGVLTRTIPIVGSDFRLAKLSGPYYLATELDDDFWPVTRHGSVAGPQFAGSVTDIFGSLAFETVDASTGRYTVRDVAAPSAPGLSFTLPAPHNTGATGALGIWGDWVSFTTCVLDPETYDDTCSLVVYNYRSRVLRERRDILNHDQPTLGDGFVILADQGVVWDVVHDRTIPLETIPAGDWGTRTVATDGSHRVAYATASEVVVVRTLEGTGTSAPRVLGIVAPGSFAPTGTTVWTPQIDVTKPLNAGTLVIRCGSTVVRTLTVSASSDGSIRHVSWDGKNTAGALVTSGTYTYELVADAADGSGAVKAVNGTGAAGGTLQVSGVTPGTLSTATPSVSDVTPVTDQTLSANAGTWGPAGVTFAYQWFRKSASGVTSTIVGATAKTYTVVAGDVGYLVQVRVTGSKAGYTPVAKSSVFTSAVAKASFVSAPAPTVSGVARVSMKLTAAPGSWSPSATLAYQWYRVSSTGTSTAITGATSATYTPQLADKGYRVKVRVTGSRTGYVSGVKYSALTPTIQSPMVGRTPTVSDTTPRVDQRLTAYTGTWSPSDVTFSYQWQAKNSAGTVTAITGATARTYAVNGTYAGYALRVKVTGSKPGYAPVATYSAFTAAVARATFTTAPTPKLSGTARVGSTLTATAGTWSPTPSKLTYAWYRVNTAGTSSLISGATASTYTLKTADRGYRIKVRVTATRTGYTTASKTSATTVKVA